MFDLSDIIREKQVTYIKRLVANEFLERLQTLLITDPERWLDELLKLSYNKAKRERIHQQLKTEHVKKHYLDTSTYYSHFNNLGKTFDLCCTPEDTLTTTEKEELFSQGLFRWMKEELIRLGDMELPEKIRIITALGSIKRDETVTGSATHRRGDFAKRQYCPYHRSASHNTKDCKAKQGIKEQK